MIFEFKKAKNGFVVEVKDSGGEIDRIVSEEGEDEHDVFIHFLWAMISYYGPSDSKYSKKRIRVAAVPGNAFEGELDDTYLKKLEWLYADIGYHVKRERNRRRVKK